MTYVLGVLLLVSLFFLSAQLKLAVEKNRELEIVKRDRAYFYAFFRHYDTRDVVKTYLENRALRVSEACDRQIELQQGKWVPPVLLSPNDKEELEEAFSKACAVEKEKVRAWKDTFWNYVLVARQAADAAGMRRLELGVEDEKTSWKDFLPTEDSFPARSKEGLKIQALTDLPPGGVSGRPTNPRY